MSTKNMASKNFDDIEISDRWAESTFLVVVNPVSGNKQGLKTVDKVIRPLCEKAKVKVEVITTEYAGHAFEIARDRDFSSYAAVLLASGDGMVNNFLNGLAARFPSLSTSTSSNPKSEGETGSDTEPAARTEKDEEKHIDEKNATDDADADDVSPPADAKTEPGTSCDFSAGLEAFSKLLESTPLAVIPVGTGNGIATSLGGKNAREAMVALLNGEARHIDVQSIYSEASGSLHWDFFSVSWGIIADHDELTERTLRWMPLRLTYAPIHVIARKKKYRGRLSFKMAQVSDEDRRERHYSDHNAAEHVKKCFEPPRLARRDLHLKSSSDVSTDSKSSSDSSGKDDGWHYIEDEFILFTSLNLSHGSGDVILSPHAKADDGVKSSRWVGRGKTQFLQMTLEHCPGDVILLPHAKASDGSIDLLVVRDTSRYNLAMSFIAMEDGTHIQRDEIEVYKVSEYVLEPHSSATGPICVSGEFFSRAHEGAIHVKVHPQHGRVIY